MNLLFAFDKGCIPLFRTCIRSVAENGGADNYQVYIIHSDLGEKEQDEICRSAGSRVCCHFIYMSGELFDGFPETKRYPRQIYYRIAAPLFLPRSLDRILYLDIDTIVINPLKGLYQMDFDGNYFLACTHVRRFLTKINQARLDAGEEAAYVNTGVMVYNLEPLRRDLSMEKIRRFALEKKNAFILPDQDIICALYGSRIKLADTMIYNLSDRIFNLYNADITNEKRDLDWVRKHTVIIHYCGRLKPWKENYIGKLGVFYYEIEERLLPV